MALWGHEEPLVHLERSARGLQSTPDPWEEQWSHSFLQLVPQAHALPSSRAPDC